VNEKPSINLTLLLLIFFNIHIIIHAQNRVQVFPRLEPDPKALEFYEIFRQKNGYSWEELAEISLWASGDISASNLGRIRAAVESLNNSPELPASGRERAEFILNFMHKNILRSYSLYQTRIDTIFANGRYNCVSSAVLYMILCKSAGIQISGVVTKEHAFATVHSGDSDFDVETTNIYGFDPGNRKEFFDSVGNITGFSYVPAQNYRNRQTISQIELISVILNNRIADHERQNRFGDAVPIAVDRTALLTGNTLDVNENARYGPLFEDPVSNMMDRIFNYGEMLLRAGREEECLRWAAAASPLYPDTARWQEFTLAAVNNNVNKLIRANRLTEARNFLDNNKMFLTDAGYAQLDTMLIGNELLNSANRIRTAEDGNAVINAAEQALQSGRIEQKRASELIIFSVQKTAAALSASPARDLRAAAVYIEAAVSRFSANSGLLVNELIANELKQTLQTYQSNIVTGYHNRFAAAWNRKNYEEAERILNEGLAEFPNNRQLLSDMETIRQQRAR